MPTSPLTIPVSSLKYCSGIFGYSRRKTRVVMIGGVAVGGANPLRAQSMTTTSTKDVEATITQALRMVEAGCEIVRITAQTVEEARALGRIKAGLLKRGVNVPLIADIHFDPAAALEAAEYVEKVRINPGNYADSKRFAPREYTRDQYEAELARLEQRFTPLVEKLKRLKRALRVGTNHGSLSDRIMNRYGDSPLGMVESALEFVRICEKNGFHDIILSMKASNPKVMIAAYRLLAGSMAELGMDYPFHLGVTEAGDGEDGRIKSAIGIGSLLEDGIGDTIRVSLTEEPEREVPVCQALAERFNGRKALEMPEPEGPLHIPDFTSYARRRSRTILAGPFSAGGEQPVRLVCPVPLTLKGSEILSWLEFELKQGLGREPEFLEFTIKNASDLAALRGLRQELAPETQRLAFLGRFEGSLELLLNGLPWVDMISWVQPMEKRFLAALKDHRRTWLVEAKTAEEALAAEIMAQEAGVACVLSLRGLDVGSLLKEYRLLSAQAADSPLLIKAPRQRDAQRQVLDSSILIGGLLCDGIGDAVLVDSSLDHARNLDLSYNILQGAGSRITKTEFVSCPSCGRTLFDLQETTERIKKQTGHLKGVKIAIMGCVVNGPGEMADADFGYVGGAPDRINLYVGKDCVKKGIPTAEADAALIELIRAHGKWVNPHGAAG